MAEYYASISGNDSTGDGSISLPWQDPWAKLMDGALSAGDTLLIRGGRYHGNRYNSLVDRSGADGSPITISAYQEEEVIIDGSIEGYFSEPGNGDWVLHDAANNVWKSSVTHFDANSLHAGAWMYNAGENFSLVNYAGYEYLSAAEQKYDPENPGYCGPGVWWDKEDTQGQGAGIVFIRLTPPLTSVLHGAAYSHWPQNTDPRSHSIYVFHSLSLFFGGFSGSAYWAYDKLKFHHWHSVFPGFSLNQSTVKNCEFRHTGTAIALSDGVANTIIEDNIFNGHIPRSLSYQDIKGGNASQGAGQHRSAPLGTTSGSSGWKFRRNRVVDAFDGMVLSQCNGVEIVDNVLGCPAGQIVSGTLAVNGGVIWDDFIQMASNCFDVEIARNQVSGAWVARAGAGSPSEGVGTIYVHNNYFENLHQILRMRLLVESADYLNDSYKGWHHPFQGNRHFAAGYGDQPYKYYNNTHVYTKKYGDSALSTLITPVPTPNTSGTPHEVYNNIFVNIETAQDVFEAADLAGGEIYDGNWYYIAAGAEIFSNAKNAGASSGEYDTLTALKASGDYADTQVYYAPGWENSGVEGTDPDILPYVWAPRASGITTGAVDLSGKSWPGSPGATRGAAPFGTYGARRWTTTTPMYGFTAPGSLLDGYWSDDDETLNVVAGATGASVQARAYRWTGAVWQSFPLTVTNGRGVGSIVVPSGEQRTDYERVAVWINGSFYIQEIPALPG